MAERSHCDTYHVFSIIEFVRNISYAVGQGWISTIEDDHSVVVTMFWAPYVVTELDHCGPVHLQTSMNVECLRGNRRSKERNSVNPEFQHKDECKMNQADSTGRDQN